MLELAWGARTDIGRRRKRNEDAYLAEAPVFAVADGMGGHARGDLASQLAVEALRQFTARASTRPEILEAVRIVDEQISNQALGPDAEGMGTTLCGVIAPIEGDGNSILVFNVGDSRIYRQRAGELRQITRDHSVVQELLDDGSITPGEADIHPDRNVITRSLGSGEPLDIDWWLVDACAEDRFLLCSDGLAREVDARDLAAGLDSASTPEEAADRLVDAALKSGGRDNITVVVLDITAVTRTSGSTDLGAVESETNPRPVDDGETRPGARRGVPDPVIVARLSDATPSEAAP